MSAQVACLGTLVADIVGRPIDSLPKKGTLGIIERIELHIGGNAANVAVALAKLGTPVAALGRVGADSFGEFMRFALEKEGVDVTGIGRDPSVPTAATIVTVHSDAERSFIHVPGANATVTADDVAWENLHGVRILHVAGLQLMTALEGRGIADVMHRAKELGMLTTLDTVMNPRSRWFAGLAPAIPVIDWLLPSIVEAEQLTGHSDPMRQIELFRDAGANNIVIKMGEDGCLVAPKHQTAHANRAPFHVPAFPVAAIDSLGAGDSWVAGFLTGLLEHWPLEKNILFANAVGAFCVQSLGATTGIPSKADVLQFLAERGELSSSDKSPERTTNL